MTPKNLQSVPVGILFTQTQLLADLYDKWQERERDAFSKMGLHPPHFAMLRELAEQAVAADVSWATANHLYPLSQKELEQQALELSEWRSEEVLGRVELAFRHDARRTFFRTNKWRTLRPAVVQRELRLLILALRRFSTLPQCQDVGLDDNLADEAERRLQAFVEKDESVFVDGAERVRLKAESQKEHALLVEQLLNVELRLEISFTNHPMLEDYFELHVIRRHLAYAGRSRRAAQKKRAKADLSSTEAGKPETQKKRPADPLHPANLALSADHRAENANKQKGWV